MTFHGKQDATKLDTKNDHNDQRKFKKKIIKTDQTKRPKGPKKYHLNFDAKNELFKLKYTYVNDQKITKVTKTSRT